MLTLALTASASRQDLDALASLSIALDARTSARVATSARGVIEGTVARSTPRTTGIGVQARAHTGDGTMASSRVTAVGEHGRLEVAGDWSPGARHATATLSGAIVVVGDTLVATRPVQRGFALVRTGAPATRIYVDNQLVGRTNERGILVVPELQPNYANRIRVDVRDLPLALSLSKIERLVAPPTLGAAVVDFAAYGRVFVHGRFVGVDTSYGNAQFAGRTAPIGPGGTFELEDVPAGRHAITVEVAGTRCTAILVVTRTTRDLDAGDLRCVP